MIHILKKLKAHKLWTMSAAGLAAVWLIWGLTEETAEASSESFLEELTAEQQEAYQQRLYTSFLFWDQEFLDSLNDPAVYPAAYLAFAPGSDESRLNFSWYSPKTRVPGVIEYAEAGSGPAFPAEHARKVTAETEKASYGFTAHEAEITGLKPSTEYVYRLGDGKGRWTETYTFHTRDAQSFNFLMIADPQIGASGDVEADRAGWEDTVTKAAEEFPGASFIVSAGDQVNDRNSEKEYAAYFSPDVLKQIPTATTIGNHDNTVYYDYHFNVPNENPDLGNYDSSGGNYYFTYGDTLFMNLNSNERDTDEHIQFIKETLKETKDRPFKWKFLIFHHSIYSAGVHAETEHVLELREGLVPAIDDFGIDAVLMGHDHSYVRTHQMKAFQPLKNLMVQDGDVINPEGTVYLTGSSASGSKYYEISDEPEPYAAVREQLNVPMFTNIEVTPKKVAFTTYRADTLEEMDSYTIVKDPAIETELPGLKELSLDASGTILPMQPSVLHPEVELRVSGTAEDGGPYDILPESVAYRTDSKNQVAISPEGKVSLKEDAVPGEVQVWAEVKEDGKTVETEKLTLSVIEHKERVLVEKGAEWTYLDDGSDQGEGWREPEFDDENWQEGTGPLGYPAGEDQPEFGELSTVIGYGPDEYDKYATAYFRTEFSLEDASAIGEQGLIEFAADDSVILYLNGHEIGRFNLPPGEVAFDDYVYDLKDENDADEDRTERFLLDEEALKHLTDGRNVLSAEVHQDDRGSSDLYWDMEFTVSLDTEN